MRNDDDRLSPSDGPLIAMAIKSYVEQHDSTKPDWILRTYKFETVRAEQCHWLGQSEPPGLTLPGGWMVYRHRTHYGDAHPEWDGRWRADVSPLRTVLIRAALDRRADGWVVLDWDEVHMRLAPRSP